MFEKYILLTTIAFLCETIDSSLGMGYGTLLTPLLFLMGYSPLEVVPFILLSEFLSGSLSAFLHHKHGNVNLEKGSHSRKVALLLGFCSCIGTTVAVFFSLQLKPIYIKAYIGLLLIIVGIIGYLKIGNKNQFSWRKITLIGIIASFNKGISGGGYGPLITGGQIISGVNEKSAIGITSLAESLTCLIGISLYYLIGNFTFNPLLGLALISGALLSVPISVRIIKLINLKLLRKILTSSITTLGIFTLMKAFNYYFELPTGSLIIITLTLAFPLYYRPLPNSKNNLPKDQSV